jgi:hypothetical protein
LTYKKAAADKEENGGGTKGRKIIGGMPGIDPRSPEQ